MRNERADIVGRAGTAGRGESRRPAAWLDERHELPAPPGACAIATVDGGVVVFSGHADGDDPRVADHGTELELDAGQVITEFDLPAPLRNVDSDHHHLMTGITPDGTIWIGTLNPRPAWYQLTTGDYEVADVWAPS